MIWGQALACFAVWIFYGWTLRRKSDSLRAGLRAASRSKKVMLGSVGIIGSGLFLIASLYGLSALGGVQGAALTWWAWTACLLVGLVFVHCQVLGAAAMITLVQEEETARRRLASERRVATTQEEVEAP
ncbi:MAG TPA: hypothetical protein PLH94_10660 [Fimbriimonadaceae bacterium]|nr:hypothetical protein [Fimbriimonadaceae bacterium]